jgi:hypothetical protein
VHAASFIRDRAIVLERALLQQPRNLRLILTHELFHFVWFRLGNAARSGFASILEAELRHRARGELGESSDVHKSRVLKAANLTPTSRCWREYACESFCDSAAWLYADVKTHPSFTLSHRWAAVRERWFQQTFEACWKC